MVLPSPVPDSPLEVSFSTGPQPFVIDVHEMSERYVVPLPASVVNDQLTSAASALPATSLAPDDPPLTVAVYVVFAVRLALGSSVASIPEYVTVAVTGVVCP